VSPWQPALLQRRVEIQAPTTQARDRSYRGRKRGFCPRSSRSGRLAQTPGNAVTPTDARQSKVQTTFKCLTLTEAGPFLAATRSVSAPQQHIPATLTSSVKMLLSEEAACEATCLHRHLQSGDQNSFLLPHPPFLGIYTLQKPINSPALLLLVL